MVSEPFNLSFEEIRGLTYYQIYEILFHERDKHGNIDTGPNRPQDKIRDAFYDRLEKQGITGFQADEMWLDFIEKNG